jgi:hypothetical protein
MRFANARALFEIRAALQPGSSAYRPAMSLDSPVRLGESFATNEEIRHA